MFEDEILDAARQAILARQAHTIVHMRNDRSRRFSRVDVFVRVCLSLRLILDEEHRIHRFPNIMKQRAYSCKQSISTNQFSTLLSKICNLQTVLIGARRITQEELQ